MRDPEPNNPDSTLPLNGSNEFIKPRRSSRSSISKLPISFGVKSSKRVLFKASKGSDSLKTMEEDDEVDGDLESNTYFDFQSVDSRICNESIFEIQAELEKELVSELVNESGKVYNVYGVVKNVNVSRDTSGGDIGPIPVPVSENPFLNPNRSSVNSLRPKLAYVDKGSSIIGNGMHINEYGVMNDKVMKESNVVKRADSFRNVVQGMGQYGNNKLKLIPEQRKEAGMCMVKPKPTKVHVWVRIMNVPLEAWNVEGISRLASMISNPIIMDRITTYMCEKYYGRAIFARVLVEVDAEKGLADNIEVCYNSLGRSMELRVEYTWKLPICTHCKVFGHGRNVRNDNLNDVANKRRYYAGESLSRGGFGIRGRGGKNGLNGRGGLDFEKMVDQIKLDVGSSMNKESLDKNPLCSLLKEEKMVYAQAYREAASDEEKLLKQKTKIEWLKEGD
nr:zinc knuckle CX2CX4HX4C [Tanacetum cinerariifolium]